MGALKKMKGGKAAGMDGIVVEMLKNGGISIIDWLLKMFNRCITSDVVPEDWKAACIVPVYKGKDDRRDYANYRGISILSISGKIYGRVLISRVIESTKEQVAEDQGRFRSGRGCIDQIFVLEQLVEKDREKKERIADCIQFGSRAGEYFEVRRGLRQGCIMSPWLPNIFFERVVGSVNKRAMGGK